jgi:eukaryotic-like serine/threonine-protein kinase
MHFSLRSKISIAISLLLIFVVGLTLFVSARSGVRAANLQSGSADWKMFGYNAAHTGYNPLETTITPSNVSQLTPAWQVATGETSSPVEANGIVYVAADKLYAINASTGATVWTLTLPFTVSPTTPTVINGVIYVDRSGTLYALNAATGAAIWTAAVPPVNGFDTSPVVAGGLVYVGMKNSKLRAYDAATGKPHWTVQMVGGNMQGGPAVANGIVYTDAGTMMYALDAKTGATKWTFTASAGTGFTPTVANGLVYFGTGGSTPTFYALNASTGALVWSFQENRDTADFFEGIAVAHGIAYIPTFDGYLYSVDALTGAQRWTVYLKIDSGTNLLTAATVANGVVYIGDTSSPIGQNSLFAFDSGTGTQLWSSSFVQVSFYSALVVENGRVFVGATNEVVSFHLPGTTH